MTGQEDLSLVSVWASHLQKKEGLKKSFDINRMKFKKITKQTTKGSKKQTEAHSKYAIISHLLISLEFSLYYGKSTSYAYQKSAKFLSPLL